MEEQIINDQEEIEDRTIIDQEEVERQIIEDAPHSYVVTWDWDNAIVNDIAIEKAGLLKINVNINNSEIISFSLGTSGTSRIKGRIVDSQMINSELPLLFFDKVSFINTTINECNFYNATFTGCIFEDTTFGDAVLADVEFTDCTFTRTTFNYVGLAGAKFNACIFEDTIFNLVDISDANFNDTPLKNVDFAGSNLYGAVFTGSELIGVGFTYVKLNKAVFTDTTLKKVDFTNATLYDVDFTNIDLSSCNLTSTSLSETKLPVNLSGLNLSRADMSKMDLTGTNLTGTNLTGANLTKADLTNVDLTGANLTDANLTKANVKGTIFNNTNITDAIFDNVKLSDAIISGVDLTKANLSKAKVPNSLINFEDLVKMKADYRPPVFYDSVSVVNIRNDTLRRVNKSRKSKSIQKQEKCITIAIVAHGTMTRNPIVDTQLFKGVNIALATGGIGLYGLHGVNSESTTIPSRYDKDKDYLTMMGKTYSENTMYLISKVFPELINRHGMPSGEVCSELFFSIFKDIVNYVKTFYDKTGHEYFPKQDEFVKGEPTKRKRRNSFVIFNKLNEKSYQMFPNPNEYCVEDSKGSLKSAGNCQLRPIDFRNLSYGIHILQSSDPSDSQYTLAGINHRIHGNHNRANLKYWDVKTNDISDYWTLRSLQRKIRHLTKRMQTRLLDINRRLRDRLIPDSLYNTGNRQNSWVSLSEIITLFKYGYGYTNINILDLSCNSCVKLPSEWERITTDVLGSHSYMKKYRDYRNSATEEEHKSVLSPDFYDIVDKIGKAKSTVKRNTTAKRNKTVKKGRITIGGKRKKVE